MELLDICFERSVRVPESKDLDMLLSWRNHDDVRRFMYTQHEISFDEHVKWFYSALTNPKKCLLVYEEQQEPLGFANLSISSDGKIADWGFYLAPCAPRGTGRHLGYCVLRHAFNTLNVHKVCGEALAFNQKSIAFHERLGFLTEGILRDQHYDGNNFVDVIRFGLLHTEWKQNTEGLK